MNFKDILNEQIALDFSLDLCDVKSYKNIFAKDLKKDGRRIYEWDNALLKSCAINNKFIFASENEELLKILKEEFEYINAGFISSFSNLKKINNILYNFGHTIYDCHHYYIPSKTVEFNNDFPVKWFEKDELYIFKGNEDFKNALEFSSLRPDMLSVCAYCGDEIMGMAAASYDSKYMWQIGINVKDKFKGMGIGAYLVNLLKEEIIKRGVMPFYGTVESHIYSQKIALKCGFTPAFWQMYSTKI
ncbi:MAG: GNAT family N-acetyltransferase [Clostridia bacterium]|nr:GNAT family N-acetyltransferase [Clostridia bacterium]